jgi:glutamate-1-semialdehyde 2,1-aminomutase
MNIDGLLRALESGYRDKTPKSLEIYRRAEKVMVKGGSHTLRLWQPYPFFIAGAAGAEVLDADGNSYIDYWQGHYANILGHNPEVIRKELAEQIGKGALQTGFEAQQQIELAETLLHQLGLKGYKIRFTTSGTLAAMYSVMLAKAYTGRECILKVGGGWHGASPYLLKGVKHHAGVGFACGESAGVSEQTLKKILITRFDDGDDLARVLKKRGKDIACFIMEPFIGVGGLLPASQEYLELARRLTEEHGVVLIFDEVISGFRFCPAGVQTLYGIRPDLAVFGKLIGGGHAVSAVVGKDEIMEECEAPGPGRMKVLFEGGTFSAHSEYMTAGLIMLKHLIGRAEEIYPRLGRAGEMLRHGIETAFADEGIEARCTGYGNDVVKHSSLFTVNFPLRKTDLRSPEDIWDPEVCSVRLREEALKLALLGRGVHVVHGGGAVSTAHSDDVIGRTINAYRDVAKTFKKYV